MFYKMDTQPNFVIGPNECNLTRDNGKVFCNISGIASSWRPVYDYLFVRLEAANELGIFNQNLTFNTPNIGKCIYLCVLCPAIKFENFLTPIDFCFQLFK